MSKQIINLGSSANDGTGDPLRVAFEKINNNFSELFNTAMPNGPDGSIQYRAGNDLTDAAYLGGTYVAIGKPNRVLTSTDASTWDTGSTPTSADLNSLVSDGYNIYGVGDSGTIVSTTTGTTWTTQTSGTTEDLYFIAVNAAGNQFVAVGANGTILTSSITAGAVATAWTTQTSPVTTALRSVAHDAILNVWVAVGDSGVVLTSTTGATWTQAVVPVSVAYTGVTAYNGYFLVVGASGTVLETADTITWTNRTGTTTENLTGVTSISIPAVPTPIETAFAVGDNGTIISSPFNMGFTAWDATTYPSTTTNDLYGVVNLNGMLQAMGYRGTVVQMIDGALASDDIDAGLSGSAKLIFDEAANLVSIASNIVPQTDVAWSLGANGNAWGNIWVSGASGLHVGAVDIRTSLNTVTLHTTGNVANLANLSVNTLTAAGGINAPNLTVANLDVTNIANINIIDANTATIDELTSSNITTGNLTSANGTFTSDVSIAGNLTVAGNSFISLANNTQTGNLAVVGNARVLGNLLVDDDVRADFYYGNGVNLTGITKGANGPAGTIQFALGDGANFSYDATLYWSNDATQTLYAPNFAGNFIGNLSGNINANAITANYIDVNIQANIASLYAEYANINGELDVIDITTTGNIVSGGNLSVAGSTSITGDITAAQATFANVNTGNVRVTANILAQNVTANANVSAANVIATRIESATVTATTSVTTPQITATAGTITTATGTTLNYTTATIPTINATTVTAATSVTAPEFYGNLNGNVTATRATITGNLDVGNVNILTGAGSFNGNLNGNVVGTTGTFSGTMTAAISDLGIATADSLTTPAITVDDINVNTALDAPLARITQLNVGNTTATGNITATNFIASGAFRGSLVGNVTGNVTGNVAGNIVSTGTSTFANASFDNITAVSNAQITNLVATTTTFGTANVNGNLRAGNIDGGNLVRANYFEGVFTAASAEQPNITLLGTLQQLRVQGTSNFAGNITAGNAVFEGNVEIDRNLVVTGGLTVLGNTTTINATTLDVEDPIINLGGGSGGTPLLADDGLDRGVAMSYYTTSAQTSYMGWKNDEDQFVFASRATITNNIVTAVELGNIRANVGNFNTITIANDATFSSNITADNITVSGNVDAAYLHGDGSNITDLTVMGLAAGANITLSQDPATNVWTITSAMVSPTVGPAMAVQFSDAVGNFDGDANFLFDKVNANLNIIGNVNASDFYGDLTGNVTGNITGTIASFATSVTTTDFFGDLTGDVTGNVTGNITGTSGTFTGNVSAGNLAVTGNTALANMTASNATIGNIYGNIRTGTQPFITDLPGLVTLNVSGNATAGNVNAGNLLTANFLHGVLDIPSGIQPNITQVGTLTSLNVGAGITAATLTTTGNITAPNVNANTFGIHTGNVVGNVQGNLSGTNVSLTSTITAAVGNLANINASYIDGGNMVTANYLHGVLDATSSAQPNITSIGTLATLTVVGNISAGNVAGGNLVRANFLQGTLTTALQPNITQVGTLSNLAVGANITAGVDITAGNLVSGTFLHGVLDATSAAQPNITSVGTLTSLTVTGTATTGNITAANVSLSGNIAAAGNVSSGNNVSGINAQFTGLANLGNIRITGSNITEVGTTAAGNFRLNSANNNLIISTSRQTATDVAGKEITITTGGAVSGMVGTIGGNLNLTTGNGFQANAGHINIRTGNGEVTGSAGGNIYIVPGHTIGSPAIVEGALTYIQGGNTTDRDAGQVQIQGGNASGGLVYGGNVTIKPGVGTIGNAHVYIDKHRWPNADSTANSVIATDGTGNLTFLTAAQLLGNLKTAFSNITANTVRLDANINPNLTVNAGNVVTFGGPVQTVGIKATAQTSNTGSHLVELRVTPTGVYIDNPFSANIDFSTSGNNLQDDFGTLDGEIGTNWTWDMSKNPLAGLQTFDLQTLP